MIKGASPSLATVKPAPVLLLYVTAPDVVQFFWAPFVKSNFAEPPRAGSAGQPEKSQ